MTANWQSRRMKRVLPIQVHLKAGSMNWLPGDWVVYCKRPFGGAAQVVRYIGRYPHRVAISNRRIETIDEGKVTFWYIAEFLFDYETVDIFFRPVCRLTQRWAPGRAV